MMTFSKVIVILIIVNIIFCKLVLNINFKYRRKQIFSIIKSIITNIHINSFIYFISTSLNIIYNTTCIYYNFILYTSISQCQLDTFIT